MITIDQVKEAQRNAPTAPETKQLQRDFAAQVNNELRAITVQTRREKQAIVSAKAEELRAQLLQIGAEASKTGTRAGFSLRAITQKDAEFLMMAPSVLGGWVAVGLPKFERNGKYYHAALLPDRFAEYGFPIAARNLAEQWAEEIYCTDEDAIATAVEMIAKMSAVSALLAIDPKA